MAIVLVLVGAYCLYTGDFWLGLVLIFCSGAIGGSDGKK